MKLKSRDEKNESIDKERKRLMGWRVKFGKYKKEV